MTTIPPYALLGDSTARELLDEAVNEAIEGLGDQPVTIGVLLPVIDAWWSQRDDWADDVRGVRGARRALLTTEPDERTRRQLLSGGLAARGYTAPLPALDVTVWQPPGARRATAAPPAPPAGPTEVGTPDQDWWLGDLDGHVADLETQIIPAALDGLDQLTALLHVDHATRQGEGELGIPGTDWYDDLRPQLEALGVVLELARESIGWWSGEPDRTPLSEQDGPRWWEWNGHDGFTERTTMLPGPSVPDRRDLFQPELVASVDMSGPAAPTVTGPTIQPGLDRLDQLVAIDAAATQAREARTAAIFAAYDDGVPITTIAGRLGVTHEAIRKMLRAAGH